MNKDKNFVVVAVVGNFKFLYKYFSSFLYQLRNNGNFNGEVIVITTYFCPTYLIKNLNKKNKITILRFKKIKFKKNTNYYLNNLQTFDDPNRHKTKKFQWHKLHLFDKKLKKWKYIFYLDINMKIHYDINLIFNNLPKNQIQARADAYPDYNRTLESQFDKTHFIFNNLQDKFDLSITNYFQTGVLYFDTSIISSSTKYEIIELVNSFPISVTNEQGIMNLYFYLLKNLYFELPAEIDDYLSYFYWKVKNKKVIITKASEFYNQ